MTSILPPIPWFVFTIFEPLTLAAGYIAPTFDTANFVSSQVPSTPLLTSTTLTATNRVLCLQLGNTYGLIGLIGVGILYFTTDPVMVRNFLLACWVADVGHLWATCVGMGNDHFVDVGHWNAAAWGNIGVTAFLFVVRTLYLAGAFGKDRVVENTEKVVKKITEGN